ncbi:MAG: coenzyme F420-0:L-glutamate ligase [Acidimicrobiales bacterium]
MLTSGLAVIPIVGLGEISPGDNLADLIDEASQPHPGVVSGDVLVVSSKLVSKAEGRLAKVQPDGPTVAEVVESQSVRVLRRRGDLVISQTAGGFVCANAGVDQSNVAEGWVVLHPADADRSARRIRDRLLARTAAAVGVIVSDTFGRPWRRGVTDVALGCAGIGPLLDLRGTPDRHGRPLAATEVAVADQLAGAAEMVMGKASGVGAAVIRGVPPGWLREGSVRSELVRPSSEDLFR